MSVSNTNLVLLRQPLNNHFYFIASNRKEKISFSLIFFSFLTMSEFISALLCVFQSDFAREKKREIRQDDHRVGLQTCNTIFYEPSCKIFSKMVRNIHSFSLLNYLCVAKKECPRNRKTQMQ